MYCDTSKTANWLQDPACAALFLTDRCGSETDCNISKLAKPLWRYQLSKCSISNQVRVMGTFCPSDGFQIIAINGTITNIWWRNHILGKFLSYQVVTLTRRGSTILTSSIPKFSCNAFSLEKMCRNTEDIFLYFFIFARHLDSSTQSLRGLVDSEIGSDSSSKFALTLALDLFLSLYGYWARF